MGDSYRHKDDRSRDYGRRDDRYDRPRDDDHFRPHYNDRPPPPNHFPPQSPPRRDVTYNNSRDGGFSFRGAADSYPPDQRRQQEEFTFRAPNEKTLTTDQRGPAVVHKMQHMRQSGSGPLSRGRGDRGGRGRGGFRGFGPKPAHTRDILVESHRETTPERLAGMDEGHVCFKPATGFGIEDDSESDDQDEGSHKRAKTTSATNDAVPKWSNPDVYTALPCPETLGAPKKDIVKEIRKAKLEAASARSSSNAVTQNVDFISFDDLEAPPAKKIKSQPVGTEQVQGVGEYPRPTVPPPSASFTPINTFVPPPEPIVIDDDGPPPPPADVAIPTKSELAALSKKSTRKLPQTGTLVQPVDLTGAGPGHDSKHLTGPHNKKRKRQDRDERIFGDILAEWEAEPGQPSTPWCTVDHSRTVNTGLRLHKEICDFYEFVTPRQFEQEARTNLVSRVEEHLRAFNFNTRDAEVKCFGSFAAGLYLPTADMDLVAMSPAFQKYGEKQLARSNSALRKIYMHFERMAKPGTCTYIASAKVPLVKFIDRLTGIKVDLSFENDSGSDALATFGEWKEKYPAMPVLVSVVKQMMLMRGMNEVFSGGIGGFTTICLVTNVLQTMPEIQSGAMDPIRNYGELLMKFLDYFGNRFDINSVGIRMDPPYYYRKGLVSQPFKQNPDRLTIIDPNRPSNDISGGSSKIVAVLECFRQMYSTLQRQIAAIDSGKDLTASILDCVIGGNYQQVLEQRERLSKYVSAPTEDMRAAPIPRTASADPRHAQSARPEPGSWTRRNRSEQHTAFRQSNSRPLPDSFRPSAESRPSSNGYGANSYDYNTPTYGQRPQQAYQNGYVQNLLTVRPVQPFVPWPLPGAGITAPYPYPPYSYSNYAPSYAPPPGLPQLASRFTPSPALPPPSGHHHVSDHLVMNVVGHGRTCQQRRTSYKGSSKIDVPPPPPPDHPPLPPPRSAIRHRTPPPPPPDSTPPGSHSH